MSENEDIDTAESVDTDDEVEEVEEVPDEPIQFPNRESFNKRLERAKRAVHRDYGGKSPEEVRASLQRLEELETDFSARTETHKAEVKRLKAELASAKQSHALRERLAGSFLAQGGLPEALSVGVDSLLSRVDQDVSQADLEGIVQGFLVNNQYLAAAATGQGSGAPKGLGAPELGAAEDDLSTPEGRLAAGRKLK